MDGTLQEKELWQQWHDWSLREEQAIVAEDWPGLSRCHEAKRLLRSRIGESSGPFSPVLGAVPSWGRELIEQEHRNLNLLQATRIRLQSRQNELEAGLRNLGRLRQSYSDGFRSCWQSYS